MWNPLPNDGQLGNFWVNLAIAVGYLPLLAGMLAATWIWGRRRFVVTLCAAPSLYFTLLHVVFVSSIRYRQPAMLAASALAASAAVHCWEQRIANNRRCASQR